MRAARRDKTVSKHNEKKNKVIRKSVSDEYATLYIRAHVLKHRFSFANHTVFRHLRSVLFHCFFQREKIFVAQSRKVSCESGAKSL